VFPVELSLARRVLTQERHQRGREVYSLHAPELERIGKGKVASALRVGRQGSVATPVKHSDRGHSAPPKYRV
jgi:transposase, IS5 family